MSLQGIGAIAQRGETRCEVPKGDIGRSIDELGERIERIQSDLAMLEGRLFPVLLPSVPPQKDRPEIHPDMVTNLSSLSSPLAEEITRLNARLIALSTIIQELHSRISL